MLCYHLGWEGEGAGSDAQGKRIRSLLVLLCTAAAGADWRTALPAAAAVEMIHNFSLVHDDIQDQSSMRRGRPTLWVKWGAAQAINAGDLMFTLAQLSMLELRANLPVDEVLDALELLNQTCVDLTRGQFLDLFNEDRRELPQEAYWPMVSGKTAALLSCSTRLGALAAGLSDERREAYARFGNRLGLAFQVVDDWLGIWGDSRATGKSTVGDLVSGKKTLPVLYALEKGGPFARRWREGSVTPQEAPALARLLEDEGAKVYTEQTADRLTAEALQALEESADPGDAKESLRQLAARLLTRQK
jgi:geranylgeranyl diphosphate synthase type I